MMTAVQLGKQTEFDRLWTWVKTHHGARDDRRDRLAVLDQRQQALERRSAGRRRVHGDRAHFRPQPLGRDRQIQLRHRGQWVLDLTRTKYFNSTYHHVKFVSSANYTDGAYVLPALYQLANVDG